MKTETLYIRPVFPYLVRERTAVGVSMRVAAGGIVTLSK
jgi:hypothetical protein